MFHLNLLHLERNKADGIYITVTNIRKIFQFNLQSLFDLLKQYLNLLTSSHHHTVIPTAALYSDPIIKASMPFSIEVAAEPISYQWFLSTPFESIRTPKVF